MKDREITLTVNKIKSISGDHGCISITVSENYVIESILQQAESELQWSKDHWGDTLKSRLWNTINNRWNGMLVGHAEYIDKMVNELLVCRGYAKPMIVEPDIKYRERFEKCYYEYLKKECAKKLEE